MSISTSTVLTAFLFLLSKSFSSAAGTYLYDGTHVATTEKEKHEFNVAPFVYENGVKKQVVWNTIGKNKQQVQLSLN